MSSQPRGACSWAVVTSMAMGVLWIGSGSAVPLTGGGIDATTQNATRSHCTPSQPCWPTPEEVEALRAALDPGQHRSLRWDACPVLQDPGLCDTDAARRAFPIPSAIPALSPWNQPLYGLASYNLPGGDEQLSPLFVKDQDIPGPGCFSGLGEDRDECMAQTRNNAMLGWEPAFTVFATSAVHVQVAVRFALRHNLCVMVAGTGHDFLNRHSCDNGVFIRTTMIKHQTWDLDDPRWPDGSVRLGAGSTFHEVQKAAAERDRYVSSGWAISVGVVGWSIGGGHGPFAPSVGMGVDNVLEVEVVTATGELIVANAEQNADLWWAVRGGGGSTWGVITSITLRAHATPDGGFVQGGIQWSGGMCTTGANGRGRLHNLLDGMNDWAVARNEKWSGLTFLTLVPAGPIFCGALWSLGSQYVFSGPLAGEAQAGFDEIAELDPAFEAVVSEATDVWDLVYNNPIEYISPQPWVDQAHSSAGNKTVALRTHTLSASREHLKSRTTANRSIWSSRFSDGAYEIDHRQRFAYKPGPDGGAVDNVGGVPSVSISREVVASGRFSQVLKNTADLCASGDVAGCQRHELYHDITGNVGSPQAPNTSIGPDFREAIYHVVVGGQSPERMDGIYYPLGRNSYLSESAYYMTPGTFGDRYWGEDNYRRLLGIKARYDPTGVFWCRHCVGDTEEQSV